MECAAMICYRMFRDIVNTFVLLISQSQKHLEVRSWTFFNSPLRVDFKTIKFFTIWCNFDRDIAKILSVHTWTLRFTEEYSRPLMSPHKHFLAPLSIDYYGCKVL